MYGWQLSSDRAGIGQEPMFVPVSIKCLHLSSILARSVPNFSFRPHEPRQLCGVSAAISNDFRKSAYEMQRVYDVVHCVNE